MNDEDIDIQRFKYKSPTIVFWAIVIAITAALAYFAYGNPPKAHASACYAPRPYCMYPNVPMCVCSGLQCYWVCVGR